MSVFASRKRKPGSSLRIKTPRKTMLQACSTDDNELLQELIDKGEDPDRKTGYKDPPLFICTKRANKRGVEILLKAGADPNIVHKNTTPIVIAAEYNFKAITTLLLEKGAEINLNDDTQKYAMFYLCQRADTANMTLWIDNENKTRDRKVIQSQLAFYSDPKTGMTLLHHCCVDPVQFKTAGSLWDKEKFIEDKISIMQFLLEHEADINAQNNSGETPLHTAVDYHSEHGHDRFVTWLIDKGANIDATDKEGQTPIYFAFVVFLRSYIPNTPNIMKLIDSGANLDIMPPDSFSLMVLAQAALAINKDIKNLNGNESGLIKAPGTMFVDALRRKNAVVHFVPFDDPQPVEHIANEGDRIFTLQGKKIESSDTLDKDVLFTCQTMGLCERAATEPKYKHEFKIVENMRMLKILNWRNQMFKYTDKTVDAFGHASVRFEACLSYYCEQNSYDGWMARVGMDNRIDGTKMDLEDADFEFAILKKSVPKIKLVGAQLYDENDENEPHANQMMNVNFKIKIV
jgi:ankyrin repeat protein